MPVPLPLDNRQPNRKPEDRGQTTEGRGQRSEIRSQWRGLKPISDVRLLTSGIDDFYGFYDLNGFNDLTTDVVRYAEKCEITGEQG